MYGGRKEQRECVASSQVQVAKIPFESRYLYHPKEDKGSCLELPVPVIRDFHSPVCLLTACFRALTLHLEYHSTNIPNTVFPSPWFRLLSGSGFDFFPFSSPVHESRSQRKHRGATLKSKKTPAECHGKDGYRLIVHWLVQHSKRHHN